MLGSYLYTFLYIYYTCITAHPDLR